MITVAAAALMLGIAPVWVLTPQAVTIAAAWLLRRHTTRRLTGVTGDLSGALIEAATAVTLTRMELQ